MRGPDLAQPEQQAEHRPQREDRHRLHLALRQHLAPAHLRRGKMVMTSMVGKHGFTEEFLTWLAANKRRWFSLELAPGTSLTVFKASALPYLN